MGVQTQQEEIRISLGGSALFAIQQCRLLSQGRKQKETIMENGENKNLQGRRDFFKEAAKKALPIIGAVALMGNPVITRAVETLNCKGCQDYCVEGCRTGCGGKCADHCARSCSESCYTTCVGGCEKTCLTICANNCKSGNY